MIEHEFAAMGTIVSVTSDDHAGIDATRRWFEHVERVASRFLPDSELSQLNDDPRDVVPVPVLLGGLLEAAVEARAKTGGLVDAAVGSAVMAWGYDRSFAEVGARETSPPAEPAPEWRIDQGRLVRAPGVRLDLGGIGKGWAADRAVAWGTAGIVSAGGDIASSHPDCTVDVAGPEGDIVATIGLGARALATSSASRRTWLVEGRAAHHIIDPRTGAPALSPVHSATVVADTAVDAEAGAKAVLIRGRDGLAWAASRPWIDGAVVVWHDGSVYATSGLEVAA
jgi:thiamine biosynthesis lipoprotein